MKKLLFLILLFPLIASAQFDFDTNTFRLDFVKLPEIESLMTSSLPSNSDFSNKYSKKLPSFKLSKENYREPVSMYEAMATTESYVKSDLKISLDPREYGIYGGNSSYTSDDATKVNNAVYKDTARGFFYSDTCPPYGICPRCAPYKTGYRNRNGNGFQIGRRYY